VPSSGLLWQTYKLQHTHFFCLGRAGSTWADYLHLRDGMPRQGRPPLSGPGRCYCCRGRLDGGNHCNFRSAWTRVGGYDYDYVAMHYEYTCLVISRVRIASGDIEAQDALVTDIDDTRLLCRYFVVRLGGPSSLCDVCGLTEKRLGASARATGEQSALAVACDKTIPTSIKHQGKREEAYFLSTQHSAPTGCTQYRFDCDGVPSISHAWHSHVSPKHSSPRHRNFYCLCNRSGRHYRVSVRCP
jgi:hypothetical protein